MAGIESLENRQLLSLTVDLRLPGGAKAANVSTVGQTVNFQIWATVKGKNTIGTDEGLQIVTGSMLSSNVNGGAANGTIKATAAAPFDASGSADGIHHDLDGDGDQDLGSNDSSDGSSMFAARSAGITSNGAVSGNSKSFLIGTGTFKVTSLKTGGTTNLQWKPRSYGTAEVWREDGSTFLKYPGNGGSFLVGAPIVLRRSGSTAAAGVAGKIFNDANKNNVFTSGESGVGGAKVFLDLNKNGALNSGEPVTLSDGGGNYAFTGLAAGSYRVRELAPSGFKITSPSSGYFDITLSSGQKITGRNLANVSTGGGGGGGGGGNTASIWGLVFSDANRNGKFDAGDTRLGNRKMFIDRNKNGKLDSGEVSVRSNASGVYTFTALAAGSYRVRRADTPLGYKFSAPSSGYYNLTLASGRRLGGKDFGAIPG